MPKPGELLPGDIVYKPDTSTKDVVIIRNLIGQLMLARDIPGAPYLHFAGEQDLDATVAALKRVIGIPTQTKRRPRSTVAHAGNGGVWVGG